VGKLVIFSREAMLEVVIVDELDQEMRGGLVVEQVVRG
jgi:hypothetical protein